VGDGLLGAVCDGVDVGDGLLGAVCDGVDVGDGLLGALGDRVDALHRGRGRGDHLVGTHDGSLGVLQHL